MVIDIEERPSKGEILHHLSPETLDLEVKTQVEVLQRRFSWREPDRLAAKRATHVLAELAKNEEVMSVIVEAGAVLALVKHLKEPSAIVGGE